MNIRTKTLVALAIGILVMGSNVVLAVDSDVSKPLHKSTKTAKSVTKYEKVIACFGYTDFLCTGLGYQADVDAAK